MREYWKQVARRAWSDTAAFLGLPSNPGRLVVAFVSFVLSMFVLVLIGGRTQMSEELRWGIAVAVAAAGLFIPLFMYNFLAAPHRLEHEAKGAADQRDTERQARISHLQQRITELEWEQIPKFDVKAIVRSEPPPNTESVYACLEVTKSEGGIEWIEQCNAYLETVEPREFVTKSLHPTYFAWSSRDGGGTYKSFNSQATIDVAAVESVAGMTYPLVVVDHHLRHLYQLLYHKTYILTISVSARNSAAVRQRYRLRVSPPQPREIGSYIDKDGQSVSRVIMPPLSTPADVLFEEIKDS